MKCRRHVKETYLGSFAVVNDTACVGGMGGRVNHTVVGARHFVSDRPNVTVIVESLAVIDDVSNTQDGDYSDRDRQFDVALLVFFDDLNLARLSQSWSLLVGLVNALGFLSSRANIGDGRWDCSRCMRLGLFGPWPSRGWRRGTRSRWR